MANSEKNSLFAFSLERCIERFPEFDTLLRARGFSTTPSRWLAVQDLLLRLSGNDQAPQSSAELAALLSPLFCSSAEDQHGFKELFNLWAHQDDRALEHTAVLQKSEEYTQPAPIKPNLYTRPWFWVLVCFLLASLIAIGLSYSPITPNVEDEKAPIIIDEINTETDDDTSSDPTAPSLPIEPQTKNEPTSSIGNNPIIPRWPPEPVVISETGEKYQIIFLGVLAALPLLFMTCSLLLRRAQQRYVLRRESVEGEFPLTYIQAKTGKSMPFALSSFSRKLRHSRLIRTRLLDIQKTIKATLNNAGFFTPIKRYRHSAPEYILLIDKPNASDQLFVLGDTLASRLSNENIYATRYYFNRDPRWCYVPRRGQFNAQSIESLITKHPNARLIVISDGEGFVNQINDRLYPWFDDFKAWPFKLYLTNKLNTWSFLESQLAEAGFHVAPLLSGGIDAVATWLHNASEDYLDPQGLWFPASAEIGSDKHAKQKSALNSLLIQDPRWQAKHAPKTGTEQRQFLELITALKSELDVSTWNLLCAIAAYPKISGHLSLAVEQRLFPEAHPRDREHRLLALSRLPWCKNGKFPEYLRRALIFSLNKENFSKLNQIYRNLLRSSDAQPGSDALFLDQTRNKKPKTRSAHTQTRDALLLSVLKGRRTRLDFILPDGFSRFLAKHALSFKPSLKYTFIVALCYVIIAGAWPFIGQAYFSSFHYFERIAFSKQTITIETNRQTQALGEALKSALINNGFDESDVAITPISGSDAAPSIQTARGYTHAHWLDMASNYDGTRIVVGRHGKIARSSDGLNWQQCKSGTRHDLSSITLHQRGLVSEWRASGEKGTLLSSYDGCEWQQQTLPDTSDVIRWSVGEERELVLTRAGIVYSRGRSAEQEADAFVPSNMPLVEVSDLVFNGALWVAVGDAGNGPFITSSSDGVMWNPTALTWQSGYAPARPLSLNHVTYNPSQKQWLAVGEDLIAYSSDAVSWTLQSEPIDDMFVPTSIYVDQGVFRVISSSLNQAKSLPAPLDGTIEKATNTVLAYGLDGTQLSIDKDRQRIEYTSNNHFVLKASDQPLHTVHYSQKTKQFVIIGKHVIFATNPEQQGYIEAPESKLATARYIQARLEYLNYDKQAFPISTLDRQAGDTIKIRLDHSMQSTSVFSDRFLAEEQKKSKTSNTATDKNEAGPANTARDVSREPITVYENEDRPRQSEAENSSEVSAQ